MSLTELASTMTRGCETRSPNQFVTTVPDISPLVYGMVPSNQILYRAERRSGTGLFGIRTYISLPSQEKSTQTRDNCVLIAASTARRQGPHKKTQILSKACDSRFRLLNRLYPSRRMVRKFALTYHKCAFLYSDTIIAPYADWYQIPKVAAVNGSPTVIAQTMKAPVPIHTCSHFPIFATLRCQGTERSNMSRNTTQ